MKKISAIYSTDSVKPYIREAMSKYYILLTYQEHIWNVVYCYLFRFLEVRSLQSKVLEKKRILLQNGELFLTK